MSALRSGHWARGPGQAQGRAQARVQRSSAGAALRLGSARLRAAPLPAPLWLLAPTLGSHMTPAPLALRASRGWRALKMHGIVTITCRLVVTFGETLQSSEKGQKEGDSTAWAMLDYFRSL
ncbi:putative uncharacterized protein FLJ13197 [Cavia porcellus]|uniref:putative uncharacterized protein FLJ13197 n=1 Tax=Cavia porcellus TaxID=10141 RepID=UPI002FE02FCB